MCHIRGYFKERKIANTAPGSGLLWGEGSLANTVSCGLSCYQKMTWVQCLATGPSRAVEVR